MCQQVEGGKYLYKLMFLYLSEIDVTILSVVLTLNYNDEAYSTSMCTCKLINLFSYMHVYFSMY